ncbi:DNA-binding response regulator, LytR/AlgR family [Flexibacter flexilis DSM 6793]|uniref:DNA-binding response regulator, LytR/AlgR family n=1 Tax=Flexibacter flexilis DSM 6793 TaxID=927664 RepID=A0A1I1FMU5_9BACT|nr:LytTR family DNA-binding domain-containing protein [Flexibacter flexilis]SFC00312.1 DNA-binding response regulator, LytR/AlgR family [Flexibacter flexilis DSM 6793]
MLKVLIVEDEEIAAEKLEWLILRHDANIVVLDKLDSIKSTVRWLENNPAPDLIFLDIHLSDGLSFELFKKVKIDVPIIFTTAYNEFAVKAFEVNSVDYLLKPIKADDIARSLYKYEQLYQQKNTPSLGFDVNTLLEAIRQQQIPTKAYKSRFLVKLGQRIWSVPVEEIAYFFAEDKLIFMVCTDKQKIPVDYTLDQLGEMLDPALFFKANRQFIVKINSISSIMPYSNSRIKVHLQPPEPRELIISNDRAPLFKQWLDQ